MKIKLLTIFSLAISSLFAQSPITINFSDLPTVGSAFVNVNNIDFTGIEVGNAGANQIYDFSNFQNFGEDSVYYLSPSQTIYPNSFPNSNLASFNATDSSLFFFNSSANSTSLEGFLLSFPGIGTAQVTALSPAVQFNLPINYNNTLVNIADLITQNIEYYQELPGIGYADSARAEIVRTRNAVVDGWGTLVTPFGLSFQVLRYKAIDVSAVTPFANTYLRDTLFGTPIQIPLGYQPIPGFNFTDTTTTYYYYTNSNSSTPMILAEIAQNNLGITTSAKYARFNFLNLSDLSKLNDVTIAPNPSSDLINLKSDLDMKNVKLLSLEGKVLFTKEINSKNTSIDLTNFNSGIYNLIINTEKGQEIKKIQKF